MYYPCSENKDADQLRGYREADSASLFSHMQKSGFLTTRLISKLKIQDNLLFFFNFPKFSDTPDFAFTTLKLTKRSSHFTSITQKLKLMQLINTFLKVQVLAFVVL